MPKLTDTQLTILANAAKRDNGAGRLRRRTRTSVSGK